MMGQLLGKLLFGKDKRQMGLELCLHRAGRHAHDVDERTVHGCDVLLISLFWYQDIYALERFLRRAGLRPRQGRKPYLLAGGIQATLSPEAVAPFVDGVFQGDGEDDLGEILDEIEAKGETEHAAVYRMGMNEVPAPRQCAPSAFPIRTHDKGGTVRVEIARGCRYKCAFCALSALKPYREVPTDDILPIIRRNAGQRISFFAPDVTQHSGWTKMREEMRLRRCKPIQSDVRLDRLGEVDVHQATVGLEGLSERLRKKIGKPFTDDDVLERFGEFCRTRKNIGRIAAYFIADLPWETDEDWAAVRRLFERIDGAEWSRRLVFVPILNPLSPKRFTRLAKAQIHIWRDYEKPWMQLLRRDGGQWGFRVVESLVWGPYERIRDALIQRGGTSAYRVIRRMPDKFLIAKPPKSKRRIVAEKIARTCEAEGITMTQLEG